MKKMCMNRRAITLLLAVTSSLSTTHAAGLADALKSGNAYGDFRLRYESVDQNNAAKNASALTLRTRLGYKTGSVGNFSGVIEMEDSRTVAGEDEFTVAPTGFNSGVYSVIADPETTELDQAFIQFKNDVVTAKAGRQVLTLDNHRYVGHVGWRQDRQVFDGVSLGFSPADDVNITYAYITERKRIFAEAADIASKDHILNASYKTGNGKLTGYAYLFEDDNNSNNELDTIGVRYAANVKPANTKISYAVEYASQDSKAGTVDKDADYMLLEVGADFNGIKAQLGYEVLGSDNGSYGFATPLATLHKFNGWADIFLSTPAQGLEDFYVAVGGDLGGGKWKVVYHDFSADKSTPGMDDFGDEIDLVYSKKFGKAYNGGVKYASYSADDFSVDTDKLWLWVGVGF
ncbi:MAG: alginate export family protein [Gammaproteobacteria bacterium]|nr:alginate export family protein [Gammaproteobacteria bacterium]